MSEEWKKVFMQILVNTLASSMGTFLTLYLYSKRNEIDKILKDVKKFGREYNLPLDEFASYLEEKIYSRLERKIEEEMRRYKNY